MRASTRMAKGNIGTTTLAIPERARRRRPTRLKIMASTRRAVIVWSATQAVTNSLATTGAVIVGFRGCRMSRRRRGRHGAMR